MGIDLAREEYLDALILRIRETFPDPGWPTDIPPSGVPIGFLETAFINDHFSGKKWQSITEDEIRRAEWVFFCDEAHDYFFPAFLTHTLNSIETRRGDIDYLGNDIESAIRKEVYRKGTDLSQDQIRVILDAWHFLNPKWGTNEKDLVKCDDWDFIHSLLVENTNEDPSA